MGRRPNAPATNSPRPRQTAQGGDFNARLQGALNAASANRLDTAIPALIELSKIQPRNPVLLGGLAQVYLKLGDFERAKTCIDMAVQIAPTQGQLTFLKSQILHRLGDIDAAEENCELAIALGETTFHAWYQLGRLANERGKTQAALNAFRQAQDLCPPAQTGDLSQICLTRWHLLQKQGAPPAQQLDPVLAAIVTTPDRIEALSALAKVCALWPLDEDLPADARAHLVTAYRGGRFPNSQELRRLALRQLFASPAFSTLLKTSMVAGRSGAGTVSLKLSNIRTQKTINPAPVERAQLVPCLQALGDDLVQHALINAVLPTVDVDLSLSRIRRTLLALIADDQDTIPDEILTEENEAGVCALALQCHLNEYAFLVTEEETKAVNARLDALVSSEAGLDVSQRSVRIRIAVIACYLDLNTTPLADALHAAKTPSGPFDRLVARQITDARNQAAIFETVPELTPIDDVVSQAVSEQYEENPYPRWYLAPEVPQKTSLVDDVSGTFPRYPIQRYPDGAQQPQVLIAGCGTGQHPIGTARRLPTARILAIDLSRKSLAYAIQRSRDLGIANVEYARADILKLGTLTQRFDLIETAGVIHHMREPIEGLKVLVGLLKPAGFVRIGVYSEAARKTVTRAREIIDSLDLSPTNENIRNFRRSVIEAHYSDIIDLSRWSDFYTLSMFRDLVFHVQEHQFTPMRILSYLKLQGLEFMGFEFTDHGVMERYAKRFPNDKARNNIVTWMQFEKENPDTFRGMYQFWAQKADTPQVRIKRKVKVETPA